MEDKKKVKKHKDQSNHYFENALQYIRIGDAEEASEFLWGSMAQALRAVTASRGITLRSHNQVRTYAAELARALNDENIWHAFTNAQSLHSNFYEAGLSLEEVQTYAERIRTTVGKLLRLISEEEDIKKN